MQKYVLGFMFSKENEVVALVRKNRPDWQAGKLNGIGGKIEEGETPYAAMVREFREEAGVEYFGWLEFVKITREDEYEIYIYVAYTDEVFLAKTQEDEEIDLYHPDDLFLFNTVSSLDWLIPLAMDECVGKGSFIEVEDVSGF